MAEVKKTLFQTGASDTVTTVDGYGRNVDDYQTKDDVKANQLADVSLDGTLDDDAFDTPVELPDDGPVPSAQETFAALDTPTAGGALDGLSQSELDTVNEVLSGKRKMMKTAPGNTLKQEGLGSTTVLTPDGEFALSATEGLKVKGGLKVLANVFGDSAICGLLEKLGMLKLALLAIFDLSLDVDIVQCISELVDTVKSRQLKDDLIVTSGSEFASKGNIRGVDKMADAVDALRLKSNDPEIVNKTNSNYKKPRFIEDSGTGEMREVTPGDNGKLYEEMDTTYKKFDPDWGYKNSNGQKVVDMEFYQSASPDAKEVMSTDPERRRHIAVSSTVNKHNQGTTVQRRYEGTIVRDDIPDTKPGGVIGVMTDWVF